MPLYQIQLELAPSSFMTELWISNFISTDSLNIDAKNNIGNLLCYCEKCKNNLFIMELWWDR